MVKEVWMKMFFWLGFIHLILLPYCTTQIISTTDCLKGCLCSQKFRFGPRTIDCSHRNFTKIPVGTIRLRDFLDLRGNNIKTLKHADFDKYGFLIGLDLRNNPIENVPSAVMFKLRLLKQLFITADQLNHFAFHGLTSLTTLRIEGTQKLIDLHVSVLKPLEQKLKNITILNTQIKSIKTHAIAGMKALQIVDLRNNQIETIGDDAFHGSSRLSTVMLSHNKMKTFPKNFQQHKSLRTLDVSFNEISSIEKDAFQGMTALRTLVLSNNKISDLDQQMFSGASNLITVILKRNQLKALPSALLPTKCSTLRYLDLSYNNIDNFNLSTTPCPLYSLKLASNPLSLINLKGLQTLRILDISKNCHLNFKDSYFGTRLRDIDVSECCLTELPKYFQSFSKFRSLQNLNLHGNNFTNFTMTFFIRNLNISSNQLENITLNYRSFSTYGTFDLSNNRLSTIRKGSEGIKMRLTHLFLRNNSFTKFNLLWITNIKTLDLSYNNFQFFDSNAYPVSQTRSRGVKTLSLRGNQIKVVNKTTLSRFQFLESVDFSQNRINTIDEAAFRDKRYFKFLNVSGNKLTKLSTEVSTATYLQNLDLSNNMIQSIDENAFYNLIQLKQLFIKNNVLRTLPVGLTKFTENFPNLLLLDISGNNLNCSCNVTIMLNYYQRSQPVGVCQTPTGTKPLNSFIMSFDELMKSKCNLCPMSPCQYKGHCIKNETAGFHCDCHEGYTGNLCENALVDCPNDTCSVCKPTTCRNGGTCIEDNGKAKCECQNGYAGTYCHYQSCVPNPCMNGGSCSITFGKFKCKCSPNYIGNTCEVYHGFCNPTFCNNHGLCFNGVKKSCFCNSGYSGNNCELLSGAVKTDGNEKSDDVSSSMIGLVVVAVLLAVSVVIFGIFIQRHGYCRRNTKGDGVELQNSF